MDWGALRHRLSCDYGWTPREIDELTAGEALECLELPLRRPTSIVAAPREAREIVAAARERRRVWVEDELRRRAESGNSRDDASCEWEHLAVMSSRLSRADADDEDDGRVRETVTESRRDGDWLKRIHEELRLLRQAVVSPSARGLWNE